MHFNTISSSGNQNEAKNLLVPLIETKALDKYSLRGMSAELEKQTVAAKPLLGRLVLLGQLTIIYAPPNTGKTLITLNLITKGIEQGLINPDQLYYFNMDDNGPGLLTKLVIAEEFGFHMLAEGERGFKANFFLDIINELIDANQCLGRIIVLDTLKKFIDVMDKSKARVFTAAVRTFVQKGGTFLALAHTNKRTDANGKAVYGGVSDFVDDADCVYTVSILEDSDTEKVVVFQNTKKRGDVDSKAAYRYSNSSGATYFELVTSVKNENSDDVAEIEEQADLKSDQESISIVLKCIDEGITTKMKLQKALMSKGGLTARDAIRLIEKYTGTDPVKHHWCFKMGGHGAQHYESLF